MKSERLENGEVFSQPGRVSELHSLYINPTGDRIWLGLGGLLLRLTFKWKWN